MAGMIQYLRVNGDVVELLPEKNMLKMLQDLVGGFIEVVDFKDGSQLIVDEDGRRKSKVMNIRATQLYRRGMEQAGYPKFHRLNAFIAGDAVFLSDKDVLR